MIVSDILIDWEGELVQEWLQRHGPFDAVVDGANVGLINQHSFKFSQVSGLPRNSLWHYIFWILQKIYQWRAY